MTTLENIDRKISELTNQLLKPAKISVDVKDAAEMIGVSKSTLYLLMEQKEIKYSSVGGKKVIKVSEVERLVNDREISGKRKSA